MVEGTIERVRDNRTLERLAAMWKDKLNWVFEVGDGVFLDTEPGYMALVFAATPSKSWRSERTRTARHATSCDAPGPARS